MIKLTSGDARKQDVCLGLEIFMNIAINWEVKKTDARNPQIPSSWQKTSTAVP